MKPLSNQARTVLHHLRTNQHLTGWQAEGVYRIRRLASRIDELRAAGYEIVATPCEDATGQRYTRYALSRAQKRRKTPLLPARNAPKQMRMQRLESLLFDFGIEIVDMSIDEAAEFVASFVEFAQERA